MIPASTKKSSSVSPDDQLSYAEVHYILPTELTKNQVEELEHTIPPQATNVHEDSQTIIPTQLTPNTLLTKKPSIPDTAAIPAPKVVYPSLTKLPKALQIGKRKKILTNNSNILAQNLNTAIFRLLVYLLGNKNLSEACDLVVHETDDTVIQLCFTKLKVALRSENHDQIFYQHLEVIWPELIKQLHLPINSRTHYTPQNLVISVKFCEDSQQGYKTALLQYYTKQSMSSKNPTMSNTLQIYQTLLDIKNKVDFLGPKAQSHTTEFITLVEATLPQLHRFEDTSQELQTLNHLVTTYVPSVLNAYLALPRNQSDQTADQLFTSQLTNITNTVKHIITLL